MSGLLTSDTKVSLKDITENKLKFVSDKELVIFASKFTRNQILETIFPEFNDPKFSESKKFDIRNKYIINDIFPLTHLGPMNKTAAEKYKKEIGYTGI
jgi:hypothetical protein